MALLSTLPGRCSPSDCSTERVMLPPLSQLIIIHITMHDSSPAQAVICGPSGHFLPYQRWKDCDIIGKVTTLALTPSNQPAITLLPVKPEPGKGQPWTTCSRASKPTYHTPCHGASSMWESLGSVLERQRSTRQLSGSQARHGTPERTQNLDFKARAWNPGVSSPLRLG